MALVWSGCTVTGVIFSNLFWEGFADYFKININILDNSWHADLDQTNVLISRWPARPPERQPALSEHVQEWYWDRERLTGQVSVSTTGLPALLDASLSSPWSQWFAGATNCMDLSAHPCLRNTDIFNFTSQKPSTPNTHMLHAYSLCHCCLSTSVQSETQQSSLWWIWWSFQEHRLPPSTESDAIAGKTHNKYMEFNNNSHTHSLTYCCCSILKNMIPTIHWWTQETLYQTLFTLHYVSIQIIT